MSHRLKHLREIKLHALEHNHHHFKVRHAVEHVIEVEKRYWPLALGIFLVIGAVLMWNYKSSFLTGNELHPAAPTLYTEGYEQGVLTTQALGQAKKGEVTQDEAPALSATPLFEGAAKGLVTTTQLSKTGGAPPLETGLLQKSLLTTFYLGETTNVLEGVLENDTKLLNEIENMLEVDLFKFLNQNIDRADALENHLNLLVILEERATERQNELTTTLNFLENQMEAQEQILDVREESFFTQLNQFQGTPAGDEFDAFVETQQEQAAVRAKIGAYETLQEYYAYYQPLLQARIEGVWANWDALIAGVKVVDIPGMDLGLILEAE